QLGDVGRDQGLAREVGMEAQNAVEADLDVLLPRAGVAFEDAEPPPLPHRRQCLLLLRRLCAARHEARDDGRNAHAYAATLSDRPQKTTVSNPYIAAIRSASPSVSAMANSGSGQCCA